MGLKSYIRDELLLEGGTALKVTQGIKQKHVPAVVAQVLPKIAKALRLSPSQVLQIGSAGRRPDPESLSGDIDIAVETRDLPRVIAAIQELGVNGLHRAMPGINVYSFAVEQPDGLVQIDLMPVASLKLAAWAFYSADADLKQGLKGSHRNELLFALAKHLDLQHHPRNGVNDAERTRHMLDLNTGLYKLHQTRMGKKGQPVKGYTTLEKTHITSDPDEICRLLFGFNVPSTALLSFDDAWRALHDDRYQRGNRGNVLASTIEGVKRKGLVMPAPLNAIIPA